MKSIIAVIFLDPRNCLKKGNPNLRIGGPDACEVKPHSQPWMVWVHLNIPHDQPGCGGSLIGSKYVLTAAHCVCKDRVDCNNYIYTYVILGNHDINVVDEGEIKINVTRAIIHEDYKGKI